MANEDSGGIGDSGAHRREDVAAVQSYQWHVLNKSESWLTQAVRTEYAGSYMVERPFQEALGSMKMIAGTAYMVRADLLREFGWGRSLTEDWELTLRLYERGYKVVYTPYAETPAECVSTFPRLARQRMRWAEGHSYNVRKWFWTILRCRFARPLEKLEFAFYAAYYLQALFFMVGTLSWLLAEIVLKVHVPQWTALLGWSLLFSNLLSLPLMNLGGLLLEGAPRKDYAGILGAIALSYLLVPFQAWAAVKGLFEHEEGPWYRTPKTGRITDPVWPLRRLGWLRRWLRGPGKGGVRPAPAHIEAAPPPRMPSRRLGWGLIAAILLTLGGLGFGALRAPVAYANPDQLWLRNAVSSVNGSDQTLDVQGTAGVTTTFGGWNVVQAGTVTGDGVTVRTTYAITLAGVAAGNRLIVAVNQDDTPGTATASISDNAGNSYAQVQKVRNTLANTNTTCTVNYNTYHFTAEVTTGGNLTITATINPGSQYTAMSVTEVRGLDTSAGVGSVDVTVGATYSDTATTHSSGTSAGTTIAANEFAFGTYGDVGCGLTITAGNIGNPAAAATKGASNDPQSIGQGLTVEYGNSGNAGTTQSATFTNSAPGAQTERFTVILSVFKVASTFTWLTATSYSSGTVAAGSYTFKLDYTSSNCTDTATCTVTVTWGFCNSGCTTLQPAAATFPFTLNTTAGVSGTLSSTVTGSAITLSTCPCNFYVNIVTSGTPTWSLSYNGNTTSTDTNISTPVLPVPERLMPLLGLALLIPVLMSPRLRLRLRRRSESLTCPSPLRGAKADPCTPSPLRGGKGRGSW